MNTHNHVYCGIFQLLHNAILLVIGFLLVGLIQDTAVNKGCTGN